MNFNDLVRAVDSEFAAHSAATLRSSGPLLDVALHFRCVDGRECPPQYGKALLDTGADRTAVDLSAVKQALPSGSFHAQGATSESIELPVYSARMSFPGTELPDVEIPQVAGTPHLKSQGLIALVGRDVLGEAKLTYDGPGGEFSIATPKASFTVKSPAVTYGTALLAGALGSLVVYLLLQEPPPCKMPEVT